MGAKKKRRVLVELPCCGGGDVVTEGAAPHIVQEKIAGALKKLPGRAGQSLPMEIGNFPGKMPREPLRFSMRARGWTSALAGASADASPRPDFSTLIEGVKASAAQHLSQVKDQSPIDKKKMKGGVHKHGGMVAHGFGPRNFHKPTCDMELLATSLAKVMQQFCSPGDLGQMYVPHPIFYFCCAYFCCASSPLLS
jgi:hypothetical protein